MEFCPKKLADVQSTLTFDGRLSLAVEISRGLTFLHRLGVVHGDLKPENILISSTGVTRLTDFGFSFNVNYDSVSSGVEIGGTLPYQAPELSLSKEDRISIDPRLKDVYSLGGVLLFLFCGEAPWKGEDPTHIVTHRLDNLRKKKDFFPMKQIRMLLQSGSQEKKEDVDSICRIVMRCFSTDPSSRGTSLQVMEELEAMLEKISTPQSSRDQAHQKRIEAMYLEEIIKRIVVSQMDNLNNKLDGELESMQRMLETIVDVVSPQAML
eukprot:TRINITY_DN29287_c0_g1_i11.p1 TRINITY_DN29287_c0_g1~~TRINITY_DN29287_c0_g1_i11.p1  ORF type:complete len:266 (-),score=51.99 TRINITY_DN29287_c0_g1_i11:82-879(-)